MTIGDSLRIAFWLIRLNRSQRWSRGRIRQYQSSALTRILRHAVTTVPYYRSFGLDGNAITSPDDLTKFPVMTKHDVQDLGDKLLSSDFIRSELNHSRTSGTSGEPTTTYYDRDCWLLSKYALKIHRMLGNGIGLFKSIVIVSEQSPRQLKDIGRLAGSGFLFKQRFLSIHESIDEHIPLFRDPGINALYAFPSYLDELINHCEAEKVSLPTIPIVFTSSEVLQNALRTRIESFFGCRVCDVYGSTEFKEIAWQCAQGTYHLNFESVFIEPAPDDGADSGAANDILVTSLTNRAMPLIRFRIGDECTLSSEACPCGLASSSLFNISGRNIDMVRLPGEQRISPYLLTAAIESSNEIARYQIVQTSLHDLEVRYVAKTRSLSADEVKSIESAMRIHLGDTMKIGVRAVPAIPRTAAGKHQVFVQAIGSEA